MMKSKRKFIKTLRQMIKKTQPQTNLWDVGYVDLRGKSIATLASLKEQEKFQINNLKDHLKELEKREKIKPKVADGRR